MHITLRAGEKLFLNGAVLRADRKVSIELMNDATFLLESHVMHVERATTPLRQLYFVVQAMLMNPSDTAAARTVFGSNLSAMTAVYDDEAVLVALAATKRHVDADRFFDALKVLRGAFGRDDALIAGPDRGPATAASASRQAA